MARRFPIDKFASLRTPFYYYDTALLAQTLSALNDAVRGNENYHVHYAIKANYNPDILKIIADAGLGADCVSGGEVKAAVEAGFKPETIVYAGVGKSDDEIRYALSVGISRFNVESPAELEVIDSIAGQMSVVAPVSIRVNPNISAHTHAHIATGHEDDKFGINLPNLPQIIRQAVELPNVEFKGLHYHIGSQILVMNDFVSLCLRINEINADLARLNLPSGDVNVGGGLGIDYENPELNPIPDFEGYFSSFRNNLKYDGDVHFELGRSIVAQCGSLINRVLYIKDGVTKRFAIIDGSMTELIRPALYNAKHKIENISASDQISKCNLCKYDVVGPVCESSDVFGENIPLPECHRGDFIAIRSAGAYGESMSSRYNCRPLPKGVMGL